MRAHTSARCLKQFVFALTIGAAITVAGCGPDDNNNPDPSPTPTPIVIPGRECPQTNILTYENFGSAFMTTWCTSCHSSDLAEGERADAPVGVDFNTYDMVRLNAVRIFARAADDQVDPTWMPPAGGPTVQERYDLGDWIACNAPREQDMN